MSASGQNWLQAQSMFDSLEMRQIRDDQGNHFHTFSRFGQNFSNLKTPYNLQHYLQLTTLLQHFCRLDTAGLSFHTSLRSTQTYTLTLEPTDGTGDGRGDNIGATGEPCFKAPAVSTELTVVTMGHFLLGFNVSRALVVQQVIRKHLLELDTNTRPEQWQDMAGQPMTCKMSRALGRPLCGHHVPGQPDPAETLRAQGRGR